MVGWCIRGRQSPIASLAWVGGVARGPAPRTISEQVLAERFHGARDRVARDPVDSQVTVLLPF